MAEGFLLTCRLTHREIKTNKTNSMAQTVLNARSSL